MDIKLSEEYNRGYKQGYLAGYQAGVGAAIQGRQDSNVAEDVALLPVELMEVSTRAKNCLRKAGCNNIGNVINLEMNAVIRIKNLGKATGKEIATWLDAHGMPYTVWNQFI